MRTTIEKERQDRGIEEEINFISIGKKGSLIPRILVDDEGNDTSVLFCEAMSGGADSTKNMPNHLSLTNLIEWNGKLYRFNADYKIVKKSITKFEEQ
jgi:hypothetical protein